MSRKKKMLITGVSGLLGNNLARYFKDTYDVVGLYNSHSLATEGIKVLKADIVSGDLAAIVAECDPDVVIHCASLTNVDYCERYKDLAYQVNVAGTKRLVESLKNTRAVVVYISTDSVYDGSKGNFNENDPVHPLNYYGTTKYEGEGIVLSRLGSLILRTNIFGINIQEKNSIAEWVISSLSARQRIQGFQDVRFSTIYTFELARFIGQALQKGLAGTYNCASSTSQTKYEFACNIARLFGLEKDLIQPISVRDFNFFAERGKNLSLDVTRFSRDLGSALPTIEDSLEAYAKDCKNGLADSIKDSKFSGVWYPDLSYVPYGRQSIDDEDIAAVVSILKSSNLTQGKTVTDFEQSLCDYTGSKFCVVFNSGTSALHAACLAADLRDGEEFLTSPNTFIASSNCGVYCRARPVFGDIDPSTYNIDPSQIEKKMNKNTRVVIPVHFAGQSCEMDRIQAIVRGKEREYGKKVFIIEDGCHALGSFYKGAKCGSCAYSDMTVTSFHPVKHITTGEGGAVFTNDDVLYDRLRRFRSHGITGCPEDFVYKKEAHSPNGTDVNPWYYEQQSLGYNYRLTDIQCALGISQLAKLPFFIRRRSKIARYYNEAFAGSRIISSPYQAPECISNWHLYVLRIDFEKAGVARAVLMDRLRNRGIYTQVHYIPVHTQPFYQDNFGYRWGDYPVVERYYRHCLSIPLFPLMGDKEVKKVVDGIWEELGITDEK
jgi:UDP-4-amino-4,6-dideoxy-N-acetyl-beta-L-altrosamine transaminase/dTDP-4-dehydrorhamnose reductase